VGAVTLKELLTYLVSVFDYAPTRGMDIDVRIWHLSGKPHQPSSQFPVDIAGGRDSQKDFQTDFLQLISMGTS
jgi:hypothetical protein